MGIFAQLVFQTGSSNNTIVYLVTVCITDSYVSIHWIYLDYLRKVTCNLIMFTVEVIAGDLINGPTCKKCSGITRLVGTERHPVMRELTALTFECARCATVHVTMAVPEHQGSSHAR